MQEPAYTLSYQREKRDRLIRLKNGDYNYDGQP